LGRKEYVIFGIILQQLVQLTSTPALHYPPATYATQEYPSTIQLTLGV
jgi:hypothetical protein